VKASSIVAVIAAIVAAMTGFVVLTVRGQDPTAFGLFASGILIPQVVSLLRQEKTQKDVEEIKHRTNGPMNHQTEMLTQIQHDVGEIRTEQKDGR